jgi:nitrile hydratase accessory protein
MMTTSNLPDAAGIAERLTALPPPPRDDGGPVFAEPWQAQAFALAVKLSEQGLFTWNEWAETLGAELKAAADRGEPDDGSHYYEHWLAALERLVTAKGLLDRAALDRRKVAWAYAYRNTPHGKPVELVTGLPNLGEPRARHRRPTKRPTKRARLHPANRGQHTYRSHEARLKSRPGPAGS